MSKPGAALPSSDIRLQDVLGQWRRTTGIHNTGSGTESAVTVKATIAQIRKLPDEIEAGTGSVAA